MTGGGGEHTANTTGHRSPELDPFVLLCTILTIALLAFTGWTLASRAQAKAAHPCQPWNFPVLTSAGWGCAESLTIGVKTR